MNYIIQLGREPALSLSEILALAERDEIGVEIEWVIESLALISCDILPDFLNCDVLGGAVKIIEPVGIVSGDVVESVANLLEQHSPEGKIEFGINGWFDADADGIARRVKKELKQRNRIVRYVAGKEGQLDSATVMHNGLLKSGGDLHIINQDDRFLMGRTMSIQNVDAWSERDYEKPFRDAKRGMLPPKLARIMLHLAQVREGEMVLDPFCGTGTVCIEASLLGAHTFGADADPDAVASAEQNLTWWFEQNPSIETTWKVLQADARTVMKRIPEQIDSIVSETFLGNPNKLTHAQRKEHADKLRQLYVDSIKHWRKKLTKGSRVVLAIPLYSTKQGYVEIPLGQHVSQLGYRVIAPKFEIDIDDELSPSGNLLYGRAHQRVLREIIVLEAI